MSQDADSKEHARRPAEHDLAHALLTPSVHVHDGADALKAAGDLLPQPLVGVALHLQGELGEQIEGGHGQSV